MTLEWKLGAARLKTCRVVAPFLSRYTNNWTNEIVIAKQYCVEKETTQNRPFIESTTIPTTSTYLVTQTFAFSVRYPIQRGDHALGIQQDLRTFSIQHSPSPFHILDDSNSVCVTKHFENRAFSIGFSFSLSVMERVSLSTFPVNKTRIKFLAAIYRPAVFGDASSQNQLVACIGQGQLFQYLAVPRNEWAKKSEFASSLGLFRMGRPFPCPVFRPHLLAQAETTVTRNGLTNSFCLN